MLYLYAIIDPLEVAPPLPPGLEGAPPEILPFRGVSAAAGTIGNGAPEANVDNLRRHLSVQNTLLTHGAVLPLRFGALFPGREQLDQYISASRETFIADLDRLRGHVEIGLRVSDPRRLPPAQPVEPDAGAAPPLGPGASYLAAKGVQAVRNARQKRAMAALATAVMEPLAPLAAAHIWRVPPCASDPPILSLAILLRKDRLDAFKLALSELRRSQPWLEILCTGPWPPYSLVSGTQAFA
jgi:hypothetical protein